MLVEKIESRKDIINDFLNAMADTAKQHDFEKHMNLISKKIEVYAIPGFETIGYDNWFSQCKHEFKEKLIKHVYYENMKIINSAASVIMFKTIEHMKHRTIQKVPQELKSLQPGKMMIAGA